MYTSKYHYKKRFEKLHNDLLVVMDLGWVDFDFYVPSFCLATLPVLPNS